MATPNKNLEPFDNFQYETEQYAGELKDRFGLPEMTDYYSDLCLELEELQKSGTKMTIDVWKEYLHLKKIKRTIEEEDQMIFRAYEIAERKVAEDEAIAAGNIASPAEKMDEIAEGKEGNLGSEKDGVKKAKTDGKKKGKKATAKGKKGTK